MAGTIGTRILERYRIDSFVKRGGMGAVYRALDERTGASVAVKMAPECVGDRARARLHAEAILLTRIRHPNVVRVLDFGRRSDGTPCLIMEFVEGETLRERVHRDGALPWRTAIDIQHQLLRAVDAIHRCDVLHLDLKSGNILLAGPNGRTVKVIDFGISQRARYGTESHSGDRWVVGTPACMAPEQLRGEPLDRRTDVYACGVVLYEMLAGTFPFPSRSVAAIHERLRKRLEPSSTKGALPGQPPELVEIALRALAFDPAHRFPDAETFLDALRGAGHAARKRHAARAATPSVDPRVTASAETTVPVLRTHPTLAFPSRLTDVGDPSAYLLGVRIPTARLRRPGDTAELTAHLQSGEHATRIDDNCWVASVRRPEEAGGDDAVRRLRDDVASVFGDDAIVTWTRVRPAIRDGTRTRERVARFVDRLRRVESRGRAAARAPDRRYDPTAR